MRLFHARWRRDVSLLALGALQGSEERAARRHAEGCTACRRQLDTLRGTMDALARDLLADPVEAPVSLGALQARVAARLDEPARESAGRPAWLRPALAAAALLLALLVTRPGPLSEEPHIQISGDSLRRIERNLAREQTVRYLNQAQRVLANVAATPPACSRALRRLEVSEEARRSRELLARRALLVGLGERHVASAGPLLSEVEHLLREVGSLEDCARSNDLVAVQRLMSERRVLMKISLVERELLG